MILPLVFALQAAMGASASPVPALTMQDVDLHRRGRLVLDLFYPERAQRLGISGEAVATCQVAEGGLLQDCAILSATPGDNGFDQAATKLLANAKTDLLTKSGEPTAGRTLNLTVKFVSRSFSDFRIRFE
jgi:protein TonB